VEIKMKMLKTWLTDIINPQGLAANRQQLHDFIWGAFDKSSGSKAPFQFRVNPNTIFVRSADKPNWPNGSCGLIEEHHPWKTGDTLQLDMHITPYRRHGGTELPMTREQEIAYAVRRIQGMGLQLDGDVYLMPLHINPVNRKDVPLSPRQLRALVRVVDVPQLQQALVSGCGGRKQYLGFGMPLLYPPAIVLS
jgi:hypothetical protein